jgi:hypothetical protein
MSVYRLLSVSILSVTVMMSCALPPPVPDAEVIGKYADSSADEIFKRVNAEYGAATQEGLDFFAPDQLKQGHAALSKAASLQRYHAEDMEVLTQLYIAEKQLNICRQVKIQAEKQMPEVLDALQTLKAKSVTRSYGAEYGSLVYETTKLLSAIEDFVLGKPVNPKKDFAGDKAILLQQLHELEIKVVKYNTLKEANVVFKEVASIGGKRLAPKTFKQAEQALQQANAIIEKDVNDEQAIAEAAKNCEFAVFHALHVARAVAKLESLSQSDYETYILDLENKLHAIADALDYRDIRNHTLSDQIQLLTGLTQRLMTQKANPAQANSGVLSEGYSDFSQLKVAHEEALQKIQELTDQIAQLQTSKTPAAPAVSRQEQHLKGKTAQLEQQNSELILQYNNLKAERDSLQHKLNAALNKKSTNQ